MHWFDAHHPAVLVSAARTPFARAGGAFARTPMPDLAAHAFQAALARANVPVEGVGAVDEVLMGNVVMPAEATNPARVAALFAGLPEAIPAMTVQRNCASGMEAVALSAERIRSGVATTVLCGGAENMSLLPLMLPNSILPKAARLARARSWWQRLQVLASLRLRDLQPQAGLKLGLTDAACGELMGCTAERLADEWGISRQAQDAWALQSHQRASAAAERIGKQIAPLALKGHWLDADDGIRHEQTPAALAKLRPIFDRRDGSVTVGNACQVTDGAAALVVMDEAVARERGLAPLARVCGYAWAGLDPARMGLGPVHATLALLAAAGVGKHELATVELNEAFAAQLLACQAAFADTDYCRKLGHDAIGALPPELLNPDGGAIALGHPVGATGARLVQAVAGRLEADQWGLATLCVGGGQGTAMLLRGMGGAP